MCIALMPAGAFAADDFESDLTLTFTPGIDTYPAVPGTQVRFDFTVTSTYQNLIILNKYALYINEGTELYALDLGWPKTDTNMVDPEIPTMTGYFYITLTEDMCQMGTLSVKLSYGGIDYDTHSKLYSTNDASAFVKLADPVTVTFDANGGTCDPGSVVIAKGTSVENAPVPVREGYSFYGWTDDAGKQIDPASAKFTEDTAVYAKWYLSEVTFELGKPEAGKRIGDYKYPEIIDPALTKDVDWDSPRSAKYIVLWFEKDTVAKDDFFQTTWALQDDDRFEGGKTYTVVICDIRLIDDEWDPDGVTGYLYGDEYSTPAFEDDDNLATFYFYVTVDRTSPQTGVGSNAALAISLLVLAVLTLTVNEVLSRRKKNM